MKRLVVALLMGLLGMAGARAAEGVCATGAHLVPAEYVLKRVAVAQKAGQVTIVIAGTGSSILTAPDGTALGYPARLQAALAKLWPGTTVKVTNQAKNRQTAAEMARSFNALGSPLPALLIWQTGTFDAMQGLDPDDFRTALDEGVAMLQARGVDVILMNMQYSPRTESMIAAGPYAEGMRWVSHNREVPLFDRLAVMKHWSELGTFDLSAATKDVKTAAQVHDCIAQLLADVIAEGAKLGHVPKPSQ
jgi:hypothetical protein